MDNPFLFRTKKEYEQQLNDYFSAEQYQEALLYLDKIENRVSDTVWLNLMRGKIYNALEQYHLALPYLLKASKQSEASITLYSEIGWTYNRLESFDEALTYLEACICMEREDYWIYSELAYSYLKKEMWEEAIVYLLNALELKPKDMWTLDQLANAYSYLGDYLKANEINIELLSIEENNEELLEDIVTLNEINETMDNQEIYLNQLKEFPKQHIFVCYHLGVYYNFIHQYQQAIDSLKQIEIVLRDSETWIELGYAYHQLEKINEAINAYEKAYQMEPEHLFLLSELAFLYGILNDYSQKLFYLDEAFRYGRKDVWLYLNYIRVYLYGLKDYIKAYYYLNAVSEFASEDEEVQFLFSEYDWITNNYDMAQNRLLSILSKRHHLALPAYFYDVSWNPKNKKKIAIDDLERVYQFSEGLAYVETSQHGGFINEDGQLVIDLTLAIDETKRQDTFMFYHGYAIVHQEGEILYGLIDHLGNVVLEMIYDDLEIHQDHLRLTLDVVTIIKLKHQEYVFHRPVGQYKEGLLPILFDDKWYYCNLSSLPQINIGFDEAKDFKNGYAVTKINQYYGVIDKLGHTIIPYEYECLSWVKDRLIAKRNGDYGFINLTSNILIDFKYQEIQDGYHGYLKVKQNDLWGMIDYNGKEVINCLYEDILPVFDECIRVEKDGCFGMYNINGELVIPVIYDSLTIAKENKIIAGIGYRYGFMNKMGQLLTPFMFQTATLPVKHKYSVSFQNQFYLIDDREEE